VTALVGLSVIVLIVFALAKLAGAGTPSYDRLVARGIPARGILLAVSPVGRKIGTSWRRFELRTVQIDVEIPGRAPYEVSTTTVFPVNLSRDVLPGATVELRVDPRNPNQIAIIGPGTGFAQAALRTS
jgi:hypothetical protein